MWVRVSTPSFSENRKAAKPQPAGCLDAGWPTVRIVYVLGREPASKYLVRVRGRGRGKGWGWGWG